MVPYKFNAENFCKSCANVTIPFLCLKKDCDCKVFDVYGEGHIATALDVAGCVDVPFFTMFPFEKDGE